MCPRNVYIQTWGRDRVLEMYSLTVYSLSTDSDVDSGIAQPLPRTRTDKSRRDLYNGYVSYLSDSVPPETSSEESVFYVSVCKN